MEQWIASIFHVTDLHLFIDEYGDVRPIEEQEASVSLMLETAERSGLQWLKNQAAGFSLPNVSAWTALKKRLPELVRAERRLTDGRDVPILVLQTGDVETFGRAESRARRSMEPYPRFKYLRETLWPTVIAAGANAVLDMYGNHDVWSGTFPMLTPVAHVRNARSRIAGIPGLNGPWPDRHDYAAPGGNRLEITV